MIKTRIAVELIPAAHTSRMFIPFLSQGSSGSVCRGSCSLRLEADVAGLLCWGQRAAIRRSVWGECSWCSLSDGQRQTACVYSVFARRAADTFSELKDKQSTDGHRAGRCTASRMGCCSSCLIPLRFCPLPTQGVSWRERWPWLPIWCGC